MKIIECPRDAMQGLKQFIPTERKIVYINQLLKVGFDTIDFGSFVSPKAVPQMKDTAQVVQGLDLDGTKTKLLAIVANTRGAEEALQHEVIDYLGFPLSLSETFQIKNTNRTIAEAEVILGEIQNHCKANGKTLVTYLSMGFGNPYGDSYNRETVFEFVQRLRQLDIGIISLADTTGVSTTDNIRYLFTSLIGEFPEIEFGAHLHSSPGEAARKVSAAVQSGCRRFDCAILGYGGCPMADNKLVGNIATETLLDSMSNFQFNPQFDDLAFKQALDMASSVFMDQAHSTN